MLLRFHRSQAYERFQQTARIVVCPLSSAFAFAFRLLFPYGLSVKSRSISESLADDTFNRALGVLYIVYAKPGAIGTEIKFSNVAMQMALAAMLIYALHATLKNRIVAFN